MSIENIYASIADYSPVFVPAIYICRWRDKNPETIRKVATGAAFAGSALLSLIDTVASLALAVFFSPLRLGGIKLTDAFLKRTMLNCSFGFIFLTVVQYDNATADKLRKVLKKRFAQ